MFTKRPAYMDAKAAVRNIFTDIWPKVFQHRKPTGLPGGGKGLYTKGTIDHAAYNKAKSEAAVISYMTPDK